MNSSNTKKKPGPKSRAEKMIEGREYQKAYAEYYDLPFDDTKDGVQPFGSDGGWHVDPMSNALTLASTLPAQKTSLERIRQVKEYSNTATGIDVDHGELVDLLWRVYRSEPMVGQAIESMIDLAVQRIIVRTQDPEEKRILKYWARKFNTLDSPREAAGNVGGLREFFRQVILHWAVTGDCVFVEKWKKTKLPDGASATLPVGARIHDIRNVSFSGSYLSVGHDVISLKLSSVPDSVKEAIKNASTANATKQDRAIRRLVGPLIRKAIEDDAETVELPGNITWHISRNRIAGETHGNTSVRRTFGAVGGKRLTQSVDHSILDGLIAHMVIIQMGTDDPDSEYHVPDPSRLQLLVKLLKGQKNVEVMAWAGKDLHPVSVSPDPKILSFGDRYKGNDDNISSAMGTPRIFIDGLGSEDQGEVAASYVSLMAKLAYPVSQLEWWLQDRIDLIREKNGWEPGDEDMPDATIQRPPIVDRLFRTHLIKQYETGMRGRRDTLEDLGYDPDATISRQLDEQEEGLNESLLPPTVPYSPQNVPPTEREGGRPPGEGESDEPAEAQRADREEGLGDPVFDAFFEHINTAAETYRDAIIRHLANHTPTDGVMVAMRGGIVGAFQNLGRFYLETRLDDHVDPSNRWFVALETWVGERVGRLFNNLTEVIGQTVSIREDLGEKTFFNVINSVFDDLSEQLANHISIVATKAIWAGELKLAEDEGKKGAVIEVPEGLEFEDFRNLDGRRLTLTQLWEIFPIPGLQVTFEWVG